MSKARAVFTPEEMIAKYVYVFQTPKCFMKLINDPDLPRASNLISN